MTLKCEFNDRWLDAHQHKSTHTTYLQSQSTAPRKQLYRLLSTSTPCSRRLDYILPSRMRNCSLSDVDLSHGILNDRIRSLQSGVCRTSPNHFSVLVRLRRSNFLHHVQMASSLSKKNIVGGHASVVLLLAFVLK